ncbi:MAG: MobA/MobL family protein, partial [Hyphomicrobiales bacterium]|nr:MobA/MobL family protein [Hyphomicrobiales bacterium]
ESWETLANKALESAGVDARIDRRSLLERGLSRLPQPALRMAWYMHDLYGCMKDRFGQFIAAKHFGQVQGATRKALLSMDQSENNAAQNLRTSERFFGWFERQLTRLGPAKDRMRDPPPSAEISR